MTIAVVVVAVGVGTYPALELIGLKPTLRRRPVVEHLTARPALTRSARFGRRPGTRLESVEHPRSRGRLLHGCGAHLLKHHWSGQSLPTPNRATRLQPTRGWRPHPIPDPRLDETGIRSRSGTE